MKRFWRAAIPGVPLVALAAGLAHFAEAGAIAAQTDRYRWVVYGVGMALAVGFHRSRVLLAVLWIGALDSVVAGAPETDLLGSAGGILVLLLGVLALSRDRGVLSLPGVGQVMGGVLLAALPALVFSDSVNVDAFAAITFVPAATTAWTGFPQSALLLSLLGLAGGIYAVVRWGGAVERGVLWGQTAIVLALHPAVTPPNDSLFLLAAGVILLSSVLEGSYAMAYLDELTGLPGRRALLRDLEGLGGAYAISMIDVDHFKRFNDKHGHDVGDQVLKLVARKLADGPRGGRAYRYGGEEFTLVYTGTPRAEAAEKLEVVRASVEGADFSLRGWNRPIRRPTESARPGGSGRRKLSVTVSIGVADSTQTDQGPEAVLKRADKALYRAKRKGRNRVER